PEWPRSHYAPATLASYASRSAHCSCALLALQNALIHALSFASGVRHAMSAGRGDNRVQSLSATQRDARKLARQVARHRHDRLADRCNAANLKHDDDLEKYPCRCVRNSLRQFAMLLPAQSTNIF